MANRSTFTFQNNYQIDQFITLQDLPPEKVSEAQELTTLKALLNPTSEQIARINYLLVDLAPYYISPELINKQNDCIVNMETNFHDIYQDFEDRVDQKMVDFSNSVDNVVNQFVDKGDYSPTENYNPKNMVRFHGSVYINQVACINIPPTDKTHWHILSIGNLAPVTYDYASTYVEYDTVYFAIEKAMYQCISPADIGVSPYNTTCWKLLYSVKDLIVEINDYVNDTTSIFVAYDNGISITHNLNKYVKVLAINLGGNSYGHDSYGLGGFGGDTTYEVLTKSEYPNLNSVKVYLNESFNGTPTITKVSDTIYQVTFSNDNTLQLQLY